MCVFHQDCDRTGRGKGCNPSQQPNQSGHVCDETDETSLTTGYEAMEGSAKERLRKDIQRSFSLFGGGGTGGNLNYEA